MDFTIKEVQVMLSAIELANQYGAGFDYANEDFQESYRAAMEYLIDCSKNTPIPAEGRASKIDAMHFELPIEGPKFVEGDLETTWFDDEATLHHTDIDLDGKRYYFTAVVAR